MQELTTYILEHTTSCNTSRIADTKNTKSTMQLSDKTSFYQALQTSNAPYVLLGIYHNSTAKKVKKHWQSTLQKITERSDLKKDISEKCNIAGFLHFTTPVLEHTSIEDLAGFSKRKEKKSTYYIYQIFKAGKTPIILSNTTKDDYAIIKALALAKAKKVNHFYITNTFLNTKSPSSKNNSIRLVKEGFLEQIHLLGLHKKELSKKEKTLLETFTNIQYTDAKNVIIKKNSIENKTLLDIIEELQKSILGITINDNTTLVLDKKNNVPISTVTKQLLDKIQIKKKVAFLHLIEQIEIKPDNNSANSILHFLEM